MPKESQISQAESLPIAETTKTMEQLHAELGQVNADEVEINNKYSQDSKQIKEQRDKIFAQIRYINSRLKDHEDKTKNT